MPFRSEAQRRYMFQNEPDVARKWVEKYGVPADLPEKVATTRRRKKKSILDAWQRNPDRFGKR